MFREACLAFLRTDQLSLRDARQPGEQPATTGSGDALPWGRFPLQSPTIHHRRGSGRWAVCSGSQSRGEKASLSPFPGGGWILTCSTPNVVRSFQGPGNACPVIFRRLGLSILIGSVPYPQHSDTLRIANKSHVFLKAQIAKRACYCFM